jgi:hypothetical protein
MIDALEKEADLKASTTNPANISFLTGTSLKLEAEWPVL